MHALRRLDFGLIGGCFLLDKRSCRAIRRSKIILWHFSLMSQDKRIVDKNLIKYLHRVVNRIRSADSCACGKFCTLCERRFPMWSERCFFGSLLVRVHESINHNNILSRFRRESQHELFAGKSKYKGFIPNCQESHR